MNDRQASQQPYRRAESAGQHAIWPLLVLFGTLYFVQGIVEPTACLPAQPIQTQLRAWEFSTGQIGRFFAIIGIAWSLKPLLGLITDFLPIAGRRRLPYLILSTAMAGIAFLGLATVWHRGAPESSRWFAWLIGASVEQPGMAAIGWLLVLAGVGVAMTDVAIDGLAVETGQPRGITGQIQSVQWFAMAVAGLIVGRGGGYLAEHQLQRTMFLGCSLLAMGSLAIVVLIVREPPVAARPASHLRGAWRELWTCRRLAVLLSAAAFLFLWNFNPFSSNVLQDYMTSELGFSEQLVGDLRSVQAMGMILGCVAYGSFCRRVPFGLIVHGSIVAGIASTLSYWLLHDGTTAAIASLIFGFAWQIGMLGQLDLSARICPTESAATVFALLMAISNSGESAGAYLGGGWYDALAEYFHGDRHAAFHTLVGIGATFTAGCWVLVPLMKRAGNEDSKLEI